MRRVLLPMLVPAIFASTVLVFADVIDDFVIVRYLSGDSVDRTGVGEDLQHRAGRADAGAQRAGHDAAGRLAARVVVGFVIYRRLTRGEASDTRGIGAFAGEL